MKRISLILALVVMCVLVFPLKSSAQDNKPFVPPIINIVDGSLHFIDTDGNGVLNDSEQGRLMFKVRNDGMGDGVGCQAVVTLTGATSGVTIENKALPAIPSRSEIDVELPVAAAANTSNGTLTVTINVDEPHGFGSEKAKLDITVQQKFRQISIMEPTLKFVDYSGDGALEGYENGYIMFSIANDDNKIAKGHKVRVRTWGSNDDVTIDEYTNLADLPINSATQVKIPVKAGIDTKAGKLCTAISIMDPSALFTEEVKLEIPVKAYRHPKLEIVAANLNQSIARRAPFTMELMLKNTGEGPAKGINMEVFLPENVFFADGINKQSVESLAPGESALLKYNLIVSNDYLGNDVNAKFNITESYGRDGNRELVTMAISGSTMPKVEHCFRMFNVKGVEFYMVKVQGGTFTMGATPEQQNPVIYEKPAHKVTLSGYWIGETEVTQALWKAVMGNNPSEFKGATNPVEKVSWDDCQEFVKKLSALTGVQFRLPTEAEWEFAARGGNKSRGYQYSGSNNLGEVAWYVDNSGSKTHPVATKAANELGLYDMSGNVWEWCQDWEGRYSSAAQTNPTGPTRGDVRVHRGGKWGDDAEYCRSAARNGHFSSDRFYCLGVRLALSE